MSRPDADGDPSAVATAASSPTGAARRRSTGVPLDALAARRPAARVGLAIGVAGALFLLAGCTSIPEDGEVVLGADGEKYVLPDGVERPVYESEADCLADVRERIAALEADGQQVEGTPEELCESTDAYHGHYGGGLWLGPLLFAGSRWDSSRASSWSSVTSGGFAASGAAAQPDVVSKAAPDATLGSRAPLTGGFGNSGKTGFGTSAKSAGGFSVGG
ncbi:hypothetical protein [Agromyces seonyuensis]|uniref:Uncharacterized protein n=1 Tax=Agromyces seonyuensis TaxID=2662446 RepID=A0A6I4NVN4_9MICO|nr:hypothetical protein [Agromyces seonyuensis]MWB98161.1 hypothetical protein [Agromyces seonyuensis]